MMPLGCMARSAFLLHCSAFILLAASINEASAVDSGSCCLTENIEVTKRGDVVDFGCNVEAADGGPAVAPLSRWVRNDGAQFGIGKEAGAWKSMAHPLDSKYSWLAFSGDSELRLEMWVLSRHLGGGFR